MVANLLKVSNRLNLSTGIFTLLSPFFVIFAAFLQKGQHEK
jgi:hypothetical protein